MGVSLEDDVTGFHPNGEIFIANLDHFYPNRSDTTEPTANEESFMARLYSDISISYEDTTSHNLGSEKEKEYHVVDLGDDKGWRYYVCLARLNAEFSRVKMGLY